MFRTMLCLIFTLSSLPSFAGEPFTIFAGKDGSVPKQPQACAAPDGTIHVTFGVGDQVYYCSISNDKSSTPQAAFQVPNMSLGMRRGPRIAHAGSSIVITAIGGPQGKGRDGDLLAYRSQDGGKTWRGPVTVNDVEASGREGLHAMTTSPNGTLWCVWLDLREKGTKLFVSNSTDDGATWSKNLLVYRSPDGSVCECCHPSIVADKDSVHVLFRNSIKGDRDMYLVSSRDQGATFGNAVRLGRSKWQLNACPMDGGMLAMNKSGEVVTAWRRDRTIFTATPKAGSETVVGVGEQPWITNCDAGFMTVWTTKRDGELMLMQPGSSTPVKLSDGASFPVVVSTSGLKPTAYALWDKRSGNAFSIEGKKIQ